MKTKGVLAFIMITSLFLGCKETPKEVDNVIEDYTVTKLPNESDGHFAAALVSLKQDNKKEAAQHLQKGIEELNKEGADVSGLYKVNLEKAMSGLSKLENDLKTGKEVSVESLREMMANAEINIAHDYLSTDDVYVLEEPTTTSSQHTRRAFEHSLNNLKKEEGKFNKEVQKEGESLLDEGRKLEKEYQDWEKRAAAHTKKLNEHFKEYYPEYYVGVYAF
ncbi:hypothetical protein [Pareuzebyella sediminis]|uniref:hypothetical protein n=1 Tax=Pareuzebyella sediminis TaxID=2607998 RepID=UPI0011EC29F3|nr:hypothetical protein [Pareuzebyella sediminis]